MGEEELPNSIAYKNAYVEGGWGLLRHTWAMRLITRKASLVGVELPSSPVDPKFKACLVFHIKGMCNTGCGNMTNHIAHTREQDLLFWGWSMRELPEISAPSAPVTRDIGRGVERMLFVPTINHAQSVRMRALATPATNTPPNKKRTPPRRKKS